VFVSGQVFTRQNGERDDDRNHETTTVFSAGLSPTKKPVSFAVVVPITVAGAMATPSHTGFEDALVSARYRFNAERLASSLRVDESYAMLVGGIEVPTGTFDHRFGRGPVGEVIAGLFSVEKRSLSLIGYAYYHHTGIFKSVRESGNMFAGIGAAWTPIDDDLTGHMFSIQLGLSHERTFAVEENGSALPDSGGSGLFVHPGLVFAVSPRLQFFALVSLPIAQEWRSPLDQQRFRFGAGTILLFSH
jgi:hypothetical protein